MAATTTKAPADYFALVKRFPLLPIRDGAHLEQAFGVIDELSVIDEAKLTPGQAGYLMVLTDLVERYEDEHIELHEAFEDGIAALEYLLDQAGLTASDLGRLLGNRQLGAALLRRERQFSKSHIAKLAAHFAVSTDRFLRPRTSATRRAS